MKIRLSHDKSLTYTVVCTAYIQFPHKRVLQKSHLELSSLDKGLLVASLKNTLPEEDWWANLDESSGLFCGVSSRLGNLTIQ